MSGKPVRTPRSSGTLAGIRSASFSIVVLAGLFGASVAQAALMCAPAESILSLHGGRGGMADKSVKLVSIRAPGYIRNEISHPSGTDTINRGLTGSFNAIAKAFSLPGSGMSGAVGRLKESRPRTVPRDDALTCMAMTIYHEARNQPKEGRMAVATVVMNRVIEDRFPDTVCDVVTQNNQFSYIRKGTRTAPIINETKYWHMAVDDAAEALINGPMRSLRGADHYHADYVNPYWSAEMARLAKISDHIFYRDDSR